MTPERMRSQRGWMPHLVAAVLIALVVGFKAASISCVVTSDPSGYLNCGRRLAEGHFFYPHTGADILRERFGVVFPESVIHGYLFANPDGKLYPFFGIGFPLIIAAVIRVLGAAWAPLTNLFLLPVFLAVYYLFVRFVMRGVSSPCMRFWVPLLSLAVVAWRMEGHLHCWVLPYRELPATTLMMAAVMTAGQQRASRAGRWRTLALAGVLAGFAATIREPVILLGASAVIARAWTDGAWRTTVARAAGYGLLFAVFVGVGYAPQLGINRVWRGSWTGSKQMDVVATNLVRTDFAAGEQTVPGFSLFNARHNFPEHMGTVRTVFGSLLAFLVLGLAVGLKREFQRAVLLLAVPAALFIAMFSVWGVSPPQPRYDFSYLMLLAPIAALGLTWLADWLAGRGARWVSPVWAGPMLALVLVASFGMFVRGAVRTLRDDRPRLTPSGLAAFARDLGAVMPPHSLTLAEIPARDYLEYLAPGNSMGLFQVIEHKAAVADWVAECHKRGTRLFLWVSPNGDVQSVPYQSDEWKGLLETEACLTHVRTFHLAPYGLDRPFLTENAELYEVTPLIGHVAAAVVPSLAEQPSRLILRLATQSITNPPVVFADGNPVAGRMIDANTYVANVPAPVSTSVTIRVESTVPVAACPPAALLPHDTAFGVRFGCDYSDRSWLDRGWFFGERPSIADRYRVLRSTECGLELGPLRSLYGDTAAVFLGAVIENRPTNPDLEWRQQDDPTNAWRAAVTCRDANGAVAGFLMPDVNLGTPLMVRQGPAGRVRLYGFYVGELTRDVPCPAVFSAAARRLWPVVALSRDRAGTEGRVFLAQTRLGDAADSPVPVRLPPEMDSPGIAYMLLPPLPFTSNSALDEPFTSAERLVWHQGFHTPERHAIWSGPEFSIVLPPVPGPVTTVRLQCEDLRPPSAPHAVVRARVGQMPLDVHVARNGTACKISVTVAGRADAGMMPSLLTFEVTPWQPSASIPGNPDRRVLGLLMRGAAVSSAPAASPLSASP